MPRPILPMVMMFWLASVVVAGESSTITAPPAPYFRTVKQDGIWWLLDPNGRKFLTIGVNVVRMSGDRVKGANRSPYEEAVKEAYGSQDAWGRAVAKRLLDQGFNTVGPWSDESLVRFESEGRSLVETPILHMSEYMVNRKKRDNKWLYSNFPDVFDVLFEQDVIACAQRYCAPRRNDRRVLGWFTDNELHWGPDWRGPQELLSIFLSKPMDAPGRKAAIAHLRERYRTIEAFNQVWKTDCATWEQLEQKEAVKPPFVRKEVYLQNQGAEERQNNLDPRRAAFTGDCDTFSGKVADRYFEITNRAITTADPNHLNLGCRFPYVPPTPVLTAASKHVDVISFNCYVVDPRANIAAVAAHGKPILISEFTFRAKDSGLPNTKGAGPIVDTQADRAAAFTTYAQRALAQPNIIGYHWFQHIDMPKQGRYDGEDGNCGVVTIKDAPYEALVKAMSSVSRQAVGLHGGKTAARP